MPKSRSLCGAETVGRGTCRRSVAEPGQRCHLHGATPLSTKRIFSLMYRCIGAVANSYGAYQAFEWAHPAISSILKPLSGLLMPEHFWELGFKPKDAAKMEEEISAARQKLPTLRIKYSQYTLADKLAIEVAYFEILRIVRSDPRHPRQ